MDQTQAFFKSLENYFDKIYVITLSRATDRHEHIKEELKGLNYSLFWGQDKDQFDVKELEEKNIYNESLARQSHRWNKAMPPGMIGCSWSHKLIYEDVIKNNYSRVLILEDDIILDQSNLGTFPQILKELPADWELFYLGYERNEDFKPAFFFKQMIYHLQRSFGLTRFSHKTIKNMYARRITPHIYSAGYHDHTHAYAVTRSGAEKLNKLQEPIRFFPDNLLAFAATNELVKGYVSRPKLINQLSQGETKKLSTYIGH